MCLIDNHVVDIIFSLLTEAVCLAYDSHSIPPRLSSRRFTFANNESFLDMCVCGKVMGGEGLQVRSGVDTSFRLPQSCVCSIVTSFSSPTNHLQTQNYLWPRTSFTSLLFIMSVVSFIQLPVKLFFLYRSFFFSLFCQVYISINWRFIGVVLR